MNNYDKVKNSPIGMILPLIIGVLYTILLGVFAYAFGYNLIFLVFLSSYLIGRYMIKYLEYYTTFHKILAAIYSLVAYLFYWIAFIFCLLLSDGYSFIQIIKYIFSVNGLLTLIAANLGLNLVFLIITPISAFCYLHFYGGKF